MSDKYDEIFNKEMDNKDVDGTTRVKNAIGAMGREILKDAPIWMRFNFILNNIGEHEDAEINWEEVNKILSNNVSQYDFNNYDTINSIQKLRESRGNCIAADMDLGAWRKEKCKECGETFYMSSGEVKFFKGKDFNLPKRCKCCRDKKTKNKVIEKENTKEPIMKNSMQIAMEKAGL